MMTDGIHVIIRNKQTNKNKRNVGSASTVLSTKRTAEVIPERLAVAEETKSGSGSPEVISGDVRGVPLQLSPGNGPIFIAPGEKDHRKFCWWYYPKYTA
jgi:hypothetical protein